MNNLAAQEKEESFADDILKDFTAQKSKGIFARIPKELHSEVLAIKASTGKSLYEIVEKSLKLFVKEFNVRNNKKENV